MSPIDQERCAWYAWQFAEHLINDAQLELYLTAKSPDSARVRRLKNVIRWNIQVMRAANQMAREAAIKPAATIDVLMPVYDADKCIQASYGDLGKTLAREAGEYKCAQFMGAPSKQ